MRLPFVVVHVPHASIEIPMAERRALSVSDGELELELLRMTDRYTDELFDFGTDTATTVQFPISRLIVDPERFLDDAAEPMSQRGMGVLYTHTSHGGELRAPVDASERERLLRQYYHPHHRRLTEAVYASIADRGTCLVLDCHSFASAALPYEFDQSDDRPEICLGTDPFHTPRVLKEEARRIFEEAGFRVAVDRPFSGTLVPAACFQRESRVLALMIEVNRRLYMDEESGERSTMFAHTKRRLEQSTGLVVGVAADIVKAIPEF